PPPSPSTEVDPTSASVSRIESVIVTTVTPGTPAASVVTIKKTSTLPFSSTSELPLISATQSAVSTSSVAEFSSSTPTHSASSSGLSSTGRVVVAVIVPIVGVALIAILLLLFWKKRQQNKQIQTSREKQVEDYGYNSNSSPSAAVGAGGTCSSTTGEETPYDTIESSEGYRGWGSTNGRRKVSNVGSSIAISQPGGNAYSDNHHHAANSAEVHNPIAPTGYGPNYTGGETYHENTGIRFAGRHSETVDSNITTGMIVPANSHDGGIQRGISNASSNYSEITHSDNSDGVPSSGHNVRYYASGALEDNQNYSEQAYPIYPEEGGYMSPPVIRDVQARRNTRIETPTNAHFPQQGNSGIAQNF
ncbi:hypothetical protein EDC01DRAFT_604768, partial [Geopyxis carbonaria]